VQSALAATPSSSGKPPSARFRPTIHCWYLRNTPRDTTETGFLWNAPQSARCLERAWTTLKGRNMAVIPPAEKLRLLSGNPLFHGLSATEIDALAARLREHRFADRQTIFSRGEPGSSLLAVVQGRVRIGLTSPEGREVLLTVVEPGQIFGELAMLDGRRRSADATACGPCLLLALERRDLLPVLQRSPRAALHLLELMCLRLRVATTRAEGAILLTVPARLARLLLELADQQGGPAEEPAAPTRVAPPPQGDLGRLIGASRQKVNLHLGRWLSAGVLARDGQALLIRDRGRLLELADGTESDDEGRFGPTAGRLMQENT
jgi:CRP-like cAMP-binding protein